jgi:ABC-type ATPase with predicted acetyltransferase domain
LGSCSKKLPKAARRDNTRRLCFARHACSALKNNRSGVYCHHLDRSAYHYSAQEPTVSITKLNKCPACGAPVSNDVRTCPACGHDFSAFMGRFFGIVVLVVLVAVLISQMPH